MADEPLGGSVPLRGSTVAPSSGPVPSSPSTVVPSRGSIIAAIARKEMLAFMRDRFWLFMTLLALVWFAVIYYFMPSDVNETLTVGIHWPETEAAYDAVFAAAENEGASEGVGLEFVRFDSTEELEEALGVVEGDPDTTVDMGIDVPEDFLVHVTLGEPTTVTLYVDPAVPEEIRNALAMFVRESAFTLTGHPLPVSAPDTETVVLGEDRAGAQIPLRERMRPMLAFIMLMMEMMALGALVSEEVATKTVTAVLVTPARVFDFLAAKGLVGTAVAFSEATLLALLIGAFGQKPLILLVCLVLGAVLATGVALIIGSSGRDFISLIFYSLLFLVPLVIPAIATLFPGTASTWVKLLPTYGLVQAMIGASVYGDVWSDVWPYLLATVAWCVVIGAVGMVVLRRKVVSL